MPAAASAWCGRGEGAGAPDRRRHPADRPDRGADTQQTGELSREGAEATKRAAKVESGTAAIGQVVESSAPAISDIATQAEAIAGDTRQIRERGAVLTNAFEGLSGGARNRPATRAAKERINHLLEAAGPDRGHRRCRRRDHRHADHPARGGERGQIGALFEQAIDRGEISLADLFDDVRADRGTEPQQVMAK